MTLADEAKKFWSASLFWRRAPDRDRAKAIRVIRHLTTSPIGRIADLAKSLLEEIDHGKRRRKD